MVVWKKSKTQKKRSKRKRQKSRSKRKRSRRKSRSKKRSRRRKKVKRGNEAPQRKKYDCALACLVMFTGVPYNKLKIKHFKNHNFDKEGVRGNTEERVLKSEGFDVKYLKTLPKGKPAIVGVDSLNYPNLYHDIFWDGHKIFDPNIGNKMKDHKVKIYGTSNITSGKVKLHEILG